MHLAIVLAATLFSGSTVDETKVEPFLELHDSFVEIHDEARRNKAVAEAFLVFDPQQRSAWIEKQGKIDAGQVKQLPDDHKWTAFAVTRRGIAEVPFPVRIRMPAFGVKVDDPDESVWIVGTGEKSGFALGMMGKADDYSWEIYAPLSPTTRTVELPQLPAPASSDGSGESILVNGSPHPRKWSEEVTNKQFIIKIKRVAKLTKSGDFNWPILPKSSELQLPRLPGPYLP